HQPVFEGHALSIRRADGVVEQSDFHLASSEANVPVEAIKSGRLDDVLNALMPVSTEICATMVKSMYLMIKACAKSGRNDLDAGRNHITADLILAVFDKILVDFDANGQPQ